MTVKVDQSTRVRPENLKIGQKYGSRRDGSANWIKEIHELCVHRTDPHIHLATSDGPMCLDFSSHHTTYRTRLRVERMHAMAKSMADAGERVKQTASSLSAAINIVTPAFGANPINSLPVNRAKRLRG